MRKPLAPFVRLSLDGHTAVFCTEQHLHLIDPASASVASIRLPHEALTFALSPHGNFCAVAGYQTVSLLSCAPVMEWLAATRTPGELYRVAIGDNALIVGTPAFSEHYATLCLWHSDRLVPLFGGDGEPLGELAPYHIRLDEPRQQILLWGLAGKGAFSGGGEPFARLFSYSADGVQLLWNGEAVPADRRGFVFPVNGGRIGIYNREALRLLPLTADQTMLEYPFGNLETVAASPQGSHLAWYWSADDRYYLRTARLDTGEILQEAAFDEIGSFPALAVDDAGVASIAYSTKPHRIQIFSVAHGSLVQQADVDTGSIR